MVLIAKVLGCPKSSVRITAGETSRVKALEVAGLEASDLTAAFGTPP
jgi:uncharacterized protein